MVKMLRAVVFVTCIGLSLAQSPSFGGCPNVPSQSSLDINKYLGDWYEVYVFRTVFETGKCIRARYSLKNDSHVEVYNRAIDKGEEVSAIGDAYVPDQAQPANLLVRFAQGVPYGQYHVIDTDYDNYSLVYSCTSILGVARLEFAWILARDTHPPKDLTDRLMSELKGYGVDTSKFLKTDQENCPK